MFIIIIAVITDYYRITKIEFESTMDRNSNESQSFNYYVVTTIEIHCLNKHVLAAIKGAGENAVIASQTFFFVRMQS